VATVDGGSRRRDIHRLGVPYGRERSGGKPAHRGAQQPQKGPDILAAEQPVIYWALVGFYTAATLTAAGLGLLVLAIAVRDLIGARGSDR